MEIKNPQWNNYIVLMKKMANTPKDPFNKVANKPFTAKNIPRIVKGGTIKNLVIGHWNINTIKTNKIQKKQIMKCCEAEIISVQELRENIEMENT